MWASSAQIQFPLDSACSVPSGRIITSSAASRPGIGDCTAGDRNTIWSDSGEVGRASSLTATKRCGRRASSAAIAPVHAFRASSLSPAVSYGPIMTEDNDKRAAQGLPTAKDSGKASRQDSRQERLKLALRDNLKRRKSQARQRANMNDAPSNNPEDVLDDET